MERWIRSISFGESDYSVRSRSNNETAFMVDCAHAVLIHSKDLWWCLQITKVLRCETAEDMVCILRVVLESEYRPPRVHLVELLSKKHNNIAILHDIVPRYREFFFVPSNEIPKSPLRFANTFRIGFAIDCRTSLHRALLSGRVSLAVWGIDPQLFATILSISHFRYGMKWCTWPDPNMMFRLDPLQHLIEYTWWSENQPDKITSPQKHIEKARDDQLYHARR